MRHTTEQMNHAANNIRILAAAMVEKAKSGHPGGGSSRLSEDGKELLNKYKNYETKIREIAFEQFDVYFKDFFNT